MNWLFASATCHSDTAAKSAAAVRRRGREQLLATNSFDHPLLKDIQFMEQLHLKSAEELKAFFTTFIRRLDSIPESCCSYKLLPCLTQVGRSDG